MKIKEQEISTLPVQEAREEKHQDKNLAVECDFNTDSVMRANNSENDAKDSLTSPEESVRHFLNVLGEKKSQTISMNIETEGKTVEEVKKEFDKLTIDIEKRTIYFNEQVQELEKRLQGDVNFALPDTAGVISSILSDVKRTSEIINLTQKAAENVNDDYRQKQLLQAGFNSVEEVSDKINDLESQGDVFRRKFLGEKRFGGKIRKINSEITLLDNLSQSQQEDAQIPRIDSLFQERFKAVQIKIIENFVNDLSFEYEKLSNQLSNQEKGEKKLSSDILESLAEDYVEKYFKTEIEEELQALMEKEESAKSPDRYRRNTIRILRDSNLVNEAVVILKEGLNKPHVIKSGNQGNYTDIEREEIEVLDSRLRTLPCQLEDIVRRGMMEDGNTANDQFAKFIEQVEKAPINIQKEIIESSFSRVKQQIIDALHSGDVHRSDQIHLSKRMEETEKTLKSEKELDFLQTVDMKQWNVFKDNKNIQRLYGAERLNSLNKAIADEVFSNLLVEKRSTDKSNKLSLKAILFKDPQSVARNVLNFSREETVSGYKLFFHDDNGYSRAVGEKYLASLTKEQLSEVKKLDIPGVMEVINIARKNSGDFSESKYIEGRGRVKNPTFDKIDKSLGKICAHYLENGNKEEKCFAVEATLGLELMQSSKKSVQRSSLIETLSKNIGLNEHARDNFKNQPELFLKSIDWGSTAPTDLREYKDGLVAISAYHDDLKTLLAECNYPKEIKTKADSKQNTLNVESVKEYLPNLINYLKVLNNDEIQGYLKDGVNGKVFEQRLWLLENEMLNGGNNVHVEDSGKRIIDDFNKIEEFITLTESKMSNSSNKDVLKTEQKKLLQSLTSASKLKEEIEHALKYLDTLNDKGTASKFNELDYDAKNNILFLSKKANLIDEEFPTLLIRKVIEKEKSSHKIGILMGGIDIMMQNPDLKQHILELFYKEPNVGYDLLKNICSVKPILSDESKDDISRIFSNHGEINEYGLSSDVKQALNDKELSHDQDILTYCDLTKLQGKKVKDKKIFNLIKLKDQIARYKGETEQQPENEIPQKQLEERREKVEHMLRGERTGAIRSFTLNQCTKALNGIVGENIEVEKINEDLINAILIHGDIRDNRLLLSDLIKSSIKSNPNEVYDDKRNQEALRGFAAMGVNTEAWLAGIEKKYTPNRVENVMEAKKKQIEIHQSEAEEIYSQFGMDIHNEDIFDKYQEFRGRKDVDDASKQVLKTQLAIIKSLENATYNSKIKDVSIYLEKDPLRVLQMGNLIHGSCLGLGKGNTFSAVANAVDVNKQVLYAEMDGEIIGRKLIALNNEGKTVQYRTYNDRLDLDIDGLFQRYLVEFIKETSTELDRSGQVSQIVSEKWYDDGIV